MWGEGGRFYWGRSEGEARREAKGIALLFLGLPIHGNYLTPYIDLYWSLGWSPLVCHVDFLSLFFHDKVTSLVHSLIHELVKVINIRQLPIVLVSFSLGSKGCMEKFLQILDGKWQGGHALDEYRLIRECICGQIYDSSPVDFTSELATRFILHPTAQRLFILHPTAQRLFRPTRITSWIARALSSGLDTILLSRFDVQRAEYWKTLYSSASMGPCLIFCSEDDELASCQIICNFVHHVKELGGDIRLVKWPNSPHIGHYMHNQTVYRSNVCELLAKSSTIYSQRRRLCGGGTTELGSACNDIAESICSLHEAAHNSNESLKRVGTGPNDHFFLPSSSRAFEMKDGSSLQDEQKGCSFTLPSINPQGVLSQILFDVCVPKNVEGWDIKPVVSLKGKQYFGSPNRSGPTSPLRFIRRSRL